MPDINEPMTHQMYASLHTFDCEFFLQKTRFCINQPPSVAVLKDTQMYSIIVSVAARMPLVPRRSDVLPKAKLVISDVQGCTSEIIGQRCLRKILKKAKTIGN